MGVLYDRLIELFMKNEFIISNHARIRMFQRNISTKDIINVIINGEIIEDYPEDKPCPAVLILGFEGERAIHVVAAQCDDHTRVITVYLPESNKWVDYKFRRDIE